MVPGGEAQRASLRGTSAYSGQAVLDQYNSNFTSQETLVTLAGDTGGRAFLDSNDFGQAFTVVRQDTSAYYILGYHSDKPAHDGHFRRIMVRVNRPGVKLDFRRGYYAPTDFQHSLQKDTSHCHGYRRLAGKMPIIRPREPGFSDLPSVQ